MSATKNELYRIEQGIKLAGENLLAAYQSSDPELMVAVLGNTLAELPGYLDALLSDDEKIFLELATVLSDKVESKFGDMGIAYLAARMSTICTAEQMQALIEDCSNA